jgi:hypothetical protein
MDGWHDIYPAGAFQGPQRGPEPDTRPYVNHYCIADERTDDSADHHSADNGASYEHCASAAADDHCASDHNSTHEYGYAA